MKTLCNGGRQNQHVNEQVRESIIRTTIIVSVLYHMHMQILDVWLPLLLLKMGWLSTPVAQLSLMTMEQQLYMSVTLGMS